MKYFYRSFLPSIDEFIQLFAIIVCAFHNVIFWGEGKKEKKSLIEKLLVKLLIFTKFVN